MKPIQFLLSLLALFVSVLGVTEPLILSHETGYLRLYQNTNCKIESITHFFNRLLPLPVSYTWEETRSFADKTHIHKNYRLLIQGQPVIGTYAKVHFQQDKQCVDFATTSLKFSLKPFNKGVPVLVESLRVLEKKYAYIENKSTVDLDKKNVWYWDKDQAKLKQGFILYEKNNPSSSSWLVDRSSYRFVRNLQKKRSAIRDIYPVHPDRGGVIESPAAYYSSTGTTVKNSFVDVKREQNLITPSLEDVDPEFDYHSETFFSDDPALYNHGCVGGATDCPNQGADAVNVYHHIYEFRQRIDNLMTQIGGSVPFSLDPLPVFVNTISVDTDGDGSLSDESNNAFYVSGIPELGLVGGIYFLRPGTTSPLFSVCPSSQWHDLAREAVVVVHEYQHYVTDRVTGMFGGSFFGATVADAIHEGYSDYFGVSHVTQQSGQLATVVGEYAFQNCPDFQRDVSVLFPYDDQVSMNVSDDFSDPHITGLSFASGLWQLSTEMSLPEIDQLALKSLFFLSQDPSFIEAIESLVQADEALNAGANVTRIRELFYSDLKFVGPHANVFSNLSKGEVDVGFRSCLGTKRKSRSAGFLWMYALIVLFSVLVRRIHFTCREKN